MARKKSPPPKKKRNATSPSEVDAPNVEETLVESDAVVASDESAPVESEAVAASDEAAVEAVEAVESSADAVVIDESLIASVSLEGAEDEPGSEAAEDAAQTTASGEEIHPLEDALDTNEPEHIPADDAVVSEEVAAFAEALGVNTEATVEATALDGEEAAGDHPGPARSAPRSVSELHLRGIIESLVFVADKPIMANEIAKVARADVRDVRRLLEELREDYRTRGIHLDELAGGWQFRSSAVNAPFVRELLQAKPVRLTRAQVETLAILAYRQPITRPEVDEIRGVDSGSAIKVLLDRELVRILGRKEDVGRPVLYGTTTHFLEFFGLKSLRDLPTLREFTELTPESEATLVRELGDEEAAAVLAGDAVPGATPGATPTSEAPSTEATAEPTESSSGEQSEPAPGSSEPGAVSNDDTASAEHEDSNASSDSGEHASADSSSPSEPDASADAEQDPQNEVSADSGEHASDDGTSSLDHNASAHAEHDESDDVAADSGEHASGDSTASAEHTASEDDDDHSTVDSENSDSGPADDPDAWRDSDQGADDAEAAGGAERAEVDDADAPLPGDDGTLGSNDVHGAEPAEVDEPEAPSGDVDAVDDPGERHSVIPSSDDEAAEPESATDPE